ncbi:MAG: hypothetical protein WB696_10140, partial [Chthoniobacterales bacterium]
VESHKRLGNISITGTLIYPVGRSTGPVTGRAGITKGIITSKAAFVILASGDSPESLGRVVNELMGCLRDDGKRTSGQNYL